ncbi:MAG: hypothetical protein JSS35_20185 [Proteobacteria bacterium]|nr:hypothetical protein [Pseudomonadota bacterium]
MIRGLAVLIVVAVAVSASATDAVGKRRLRTHQSIHLKDGLYTTPDRKVTCRVLGDRMSCSNHQVLILCAKFVCAPHFEGLDYNDPMAIRGVDEISPARQVLAPGAEIEVGEVSCSIHRTYIDCLLPDARGGFQMSDFFVRNTNVDTAPRGWPWDGHHYSAKDRYPYPL